MKVRNGKNVPEGVTVVKGDLFDTASSTCHVYNTNNPHPGQEDDVVEPQHPYPASKVAAEKELRESGLNWSILRFPFVFMLVDCLPVALAFNQ